jgi:hypothetical protein
LEDTELGDLVAHVQDRAEKREEVLDVAGLEVADAAVLDERDVAPPELELEQRGVMAARINTFCSRNAARS